jgi:hypothetical protein
MAMSSPGVHQAVPFPVARRVLSSMPASITWLLVVLPAAWAGGVRVLVWTKPSGRSSIHRHENGEEDDRQKGHDGRENECFHQGETPVMTLGVRHGVGSLPCLSLRPGLPRLAPGGRGDNAV